MKSYQKPAVVSPGYYPEPVEAGCCLTSCGGKPGGLQAGKQLHEEAKRISKMLTEAIQ
tara:strand:+ start:898 stop:1071 length:174 start_codon:yes stop_codon:yes gene_type:complete